MLLTVQTKQLRVGGFPSTAPQISIMAEKECMQKTTTHHLISKRGFGLGNFLLLSSLKRNTDGSDQSKRGKTISDP